jgi:hypothetical protein
LDRIVILHITFSVKDLGSKGSSTWGVGSLKEFQTSKLNVKGAKASGTKGLSQR